MASDSAGHATTMGIPLPVGGLPIGTSIQEFRIKAVLGEGGFAIVYLADDVSLHREVALKEYMPAALAVRATDWRVGPRSGSHRETFAKGLSSFINEARMLARFKHPALIDVLRFWTENGTAYMAMPYYRGKTLRQLARDPGAIRDEAGVRRLIEPILNALELMHRDNCFHRDISTDNIMVLPDGSPVLLDFGAARRIVADPEQVATIILKPGFAPIEQYSDDLEAAPQGPWTDIYALSAVCYFIISGKMPTASVARIVRDSVIPLASMSLTGFTQGFLQALDRGLGVHPVDRPQTVREFLDLLGPTEVSPPPSVQRSAPSKSDSSRQRTNPAEGDRMLLPPLDSTLPVDEEVSSSCSATLGKMDGSPSVQSPSISALLTTGIAQVKSGRDAVGKKIADIASSGRQASGSEHSSGSDQSEGSQASDSKSVSEVLDRLRDWFAELPALARAGWVIGAIVLLFGGFFAYRSMTSSELILPLPTPVPPQMATEPSKVEVGVPPVPTPPPDIEKAPPPDIEKAPPPDVNAPPIGAGPPLGPEPNPGHQGESKSPVVAKTGVAVVSVKPWGNVSIDGESVGVVPPVRRLPLAVGSHEVIIEHPSAGKKIFVVDIKPGRTVWLNHTFENLGRVSAQTATSGTAQSSQSVAVAAAPAQSAAATLPMKARKPEPSGEVRLYIKPSGKVAVDGEVVGMSPPLRQLRLASGHHTMAITNPSGAPFYVEFDVVAGRTTPIFHDFASRDAAAK